VNLLQVLDTGSRCTETVFWRIHFGSLKRDPVHRIVIIGLLVREWAQFFIMVLFETDRSIIKRIPCRKARKAAAALTAEPLGTAELKGIGAVDIWRLAGRPMV
jgi:hypothetical protein